MPEIFNPHKANETSVVVGVRADPTLRFTLEQRVDGWQLDFPVRSGIAALINDLAVVVVPIEPVEESTRSSHLNTLARLLNRGYTGWFNKDNAISLWLSGQELIGVRRQYGGGGDHDVAYLRFADQAALRATFLALLPEGEVLDNHEFLRFQRLGKILTALGMRTDENLSRLQEMLPEDHWIKGKALSGSSRP